MSHQINNVFMMLCIFLFFYKATKNKKDVHMVFLTNDIFTERTVSQLFCFNSPVQPTKTCHELADLESNSGEFI